MASSFDFTITSDQSDRLLTPKLLTHIHGTALTAPVEQSDSQLQLLRQTPSRHCAASTANMEMSVTNPRTFP